MSIASLWLVFLTGLASAGHCIGMCGGIISAVTLNSKLSPLQTNVLYHCGRALSYTVFGVVLGIAGSLIDAAAAWSGIKGIASIIGGVMLLLWVWRKYQISQLEAVASTVHARLIKVVKYFKGGERLYLFITGIAFGFLPCGLTYAMGMGAAATGSWFAGGLTMLIFSAGTLPALVLTASVSVLASRKWRRIMYWVATILAIIIGLLSIYRGVMNNGWFG